MKHDLFRACSLIPMMRFARSGNSGSKSDSAPPISLFSQLHLSSASTPLPPRSRPNNAQSSVHSHGSPRWNGGSNPASSWDRASTLETYVRPIVSTTWFRTGSTRWCRYWRKRRCPLRQRNDSCGYPHCGPKRECLVGLCEGYRQCGESCREYR